MSPRPGPIDFSYATYARFLETIPDAAVVVNPEGRIVIANSACEDLFGYDEEALNGRPLDILLPPEQRSAHTAHLADYFRQPFLRPMQRVPEFHGQHFDGSGVPLAITLEPVSLEGTLHVLCLMRDCRMSDETIRQLREAVEREHALATTDYLTGALNRRQFSDYLERENERCARYGHPFTLVSFDLDNFKEVNDALGHAAGDQVLRVVVQEVQDRLRKADSIARLGGDEFALLLPEADSAAARTLVSGLRDAVGDAMRRHGWPVTLSVGAVTCYGEALPSAGLLDLADSLMYEVKRAGKDGARFAEVGRDGTPPLSGIS